MRKLKIIGTKTLYTEGGRVITDIKEIDLYPLSKASLEMISSLESFDKQLSLYLDFRKSFCLEELSQYVETFSEEEEIDLLDLYSSGNFGLSLIDDFHVSEVIRREDPAYNELLLLMNPDQSDEPPFSFLKISEKPYHMVVGGKVKSLLEQGYSLSFMF